MRTIAVPFVVSLLALSVASLAGCLTLQAELPEDAVRQMAREDGADLAAICAHDGRRFSEGARVCMAGQRMSCDSAGRWTEEGVCEAEPALAHAVD